MDLLENAKNYAKSLYQGKKEDGRFVSAIIVAAGRGTRMREGKLGKEVIGGAAAGNSALYDTIVGDIAAGDDIASGVAKQFISLCGIAAIARTISAFEASRRIDEIIVVARRQDLPKMCGTVQEFGFSKVKHILVGGETRQRSAAIGLKAVDERACYVAVHDGARPLVTSACIDRVVERAFESGAVSAAVRVKDTLKIADENGVVLSTPDRQQLFAVQTPQVFLLQLYRSALEAATQSGADYTDDCQLIEAVGGHVQLVEGEYTNIKITTTGDVPQAEAILRARGEAF